jgi:hypothetical protein
MAPLILNLGLGGEWSTCLPGVNTGTHRIGGLVGLSVGMNLLEKGENALPRPAFETRIFQQIAWSQFHYAAFFNNRKTLRYCLHSAVNSSVFLFSFLIKEFEEGNEERGVQFRNLFPLVPVPPQVILRLVK